MAAKRLFLFFVIGNDDGKEKMSNQHYGGCDPPIPWIGGKSVLIPVIRRIMPDYPKKYVEVFGGGGALTFSGKIAPIQIYNDFNQHLVNFMRTLKSRADELISRLTGVYNADGSLSDDLIRAYFLNARDQFIISSKVFYHGEDFDDYYEQIKKIINSAQTHDEKLHKLWLAGEIIKEYDDRTKDPRLWDAVNFYILMKCSYSATGTSWAIKPVNYESVINLLNGAFRMLQSVIIEHKDCIDLIKFHDAPGTFFYCDPPYYMAEDLYNGVPLFGDEKHKQLHDTLLNCESKVLLSYNDCKFIDELYCEDKWYKMRVARPNSMILHNEPGALYNEFLIANYDIFSLYNNGVQTTFFNDYEPIDNEGRIVL
ncbi:DNA adenine methylase [Ruminococcus albus]|uniref:DNA adenine methylase n=1 Tax=Ruminococcus albus TaxID=1264 RepID=A0A1I1MA70_RUMAL|nr:DNA adenine methylase [Ruminococcus albus]SFC80098.1 DNA adenine methylase [Ruminococcus albus]